MTPIEKRLENRVFGRLESASTNLFVSGWARLESGESTTVELAINGVVLTEKQACKVRPDLISAGMSNGRFGFEINIRKDAIIQLNNDIVVTAAGQQLDGSPWRLKLGSLIDLRIEEARQGRIFVEMRGWPGGQIGGRLLRDGDVVANLEFRQVKAQHSRGEFDHEGCWEIPILMQDGRPHVYTFEIQDEDTIVRSDAVILSYPDFKFHVDHADLQSVSGWVFRKDSAVPIELEIYVDDQLDQIVEASLPRQDVQNTFELKNCNCGFNFGLNPEGSGAACILKLRDIQTGIFVVEIAIADREALLKEILTSWRSNSIFKLSPHFHSLVPLAFTSNNATVVSVSNMPNVLTDEAPEAVVVVIPIYKGSLETAECLDSVFEARNKTPSRVILINDCSPDPIINDLLDAIEKQGRKDLIIIRRSKNGGFSETVNIGMIIAEDKHVVLLNADTVVQHGWIDRLVAAAQSDPMIATVTPLSNNGEIVTVPYPCKTLAINDPELAREVDRRAAVCNSGMTVDIPVGVGFCMFIRRQCIEEIGLFDAATWGRGYGEEVDFCLKASSHGWRHVAALDTFVVHRGNVSFGDEKFVRIIESAKKISKLYPGYDEQIQRFIAKDPIGPARRSISLALIADAIGEGRILHVTHSFGGGTDKYVRDLSALHKQEGLIPLVLRFNIDGQAELEADLEGTYLSGFFKDRHAETYKGFEIETLKSDLKQLNIERIHLHAAFGIPLSFLDWLTNSFPFNATIHDYAWICPRVTLTQLGGVYCGEPTVQHCENCIVQHSTHSGLLNTFRDSGGSVALYRKTMGNILNRAETVFAGADDVVKRLKRYDFDAAYHVTPHWEKESELDLRMPSRARASNGQVRVAVFGAISEVKGFRKLLECAKYAYENEIRLTFIIFGFTMNDELASSFSNITITGAYDDDDLERLVSEYRPDISFFPNQWPETYSYTLSHSLRLGLWPVVTELGAPAERVVEHGFGEIVGHDASAEVLCNSLLAAGRRNGS